MGLFGRGRRGDPDPEDADLDLASEPDDEAEEERLNRTRGPFDASEIDDDVERIDLGSLRIAPVDGLRLQLELDQQQQNVVGVQALIGQTGVQLQAFAAPRTLGVWPDIRSEIAESVLAQGGTAEVVDGPLGRELAAVIPAQSPDGRRVQNQVRFLGVDGPRWFLRAVISGAGAVDRSKDGAVVDLVRSVVVVRDDEARPPREALPLQVPQDATAPTPEAEAPTTTEASAYSAADLKPFERGPEITEVR